MDGTGYRIDGKVAIVSGVGNSRGFRSTDAHRMASGHGYQKSSTWPHVLSFTGVSVCGK